MKKIVRLTESDLVRLVRRVINEGDSATGTYFYPQDLNVRLANSVKLSAMVLPDFTLSREGSFWLKPVSSDGTKYTFRVQNTKNGGNPFAMMSVNPYKEGDIITIINQGGDYKIDQRGFFR